jgi:WD40 repeat protein
MSARMNAGDRVGSYRILEALGRGGMGAVYRAQDETTGRLVALKVILPEHAQDPEFMERFRAEAHAAAALVHPHVAVLYQAGEDQGRHFLAFELVPGGTLDERLFKRGRLPWPEACERCGEVASALAALHAAGLVHRDLKPENVLLDAVGRAKLSDFGLVRLDRSKWLSMTGSVTHAGDIVGSLSYMSPEQADGRKDVDARADLYSLGALLFALLTGRPPFEGAGVEVMKRLFFEPPPSPRSLAPEIPARLDRLVLSLLAKDPAKRPADALSVQRELEQIARGRRTSALPVAGALALLVLAGAAVFWPGTPPPAPEPVAPKAPPPPRAPTPRPIYESRSMKLASIWGTRAGRHEGLVHWVAASDDGKLVASCGVDKTVRIWDATDLRPLHCFAQIEDDVTSLAFVPGSTQVLGAGLDGAVCLWSLEREKELRRFEGDRGVVQCIAISRDGKRALGALRNRIAVWDFASGERVRWLEGHESTVTSVAFSPDGEMALSSSEDRTLRLWDLATGTLLRTFERQPAPLYCASFSSDGTRAVCGAEDAFPRTFDVATGNLLRAYPGHTQWVCSAVFSADGKRILTGSRDSTIRIFSAETGATERVIEGHASWVTCVRWFPDEKKIVSASNDGSVRLWDAATGRELVSAPGHLGPCTAIALSSDGRRAVTAGGYDRTVRVWDAARGIEVRSLAGHDPGVVAVAISADGRRALSGGTKDALTPSARGELILRDLDADESQVLPGSRLPVTAVALSPDGRHGATAGRGNPRGEGFIWTFDGGAPVATRVAGAEAGGFSLAFDQDAATFLAGTMRGVQAWDLGSFQAKPLTGLTQAITALASEGQVALSAELGGALLAWNRSNPDGATRLEGHQGAVTSVAISRDRELAVSAGAEDGTVRLWSLSRKAEIDRIDMTLRGEHPRAVAFCPDSRSFLVTTTLGVVLRFEVHIP